jgi:hypothetical protein
MVVRCIAGVAELVSTPDKEGCQLSYLQINKHYLGLSYLALEQNIIASHADASSMFMY